MIYYSIFIQFLLFSEAFSLYDWLHSTRFHKMIDPSDSTYAHEPMEILGSGSVYPLQDVSNHSYEVESEYSGNRHYCDRVCKKDEYMVCKFKFDIELHSTLNKACFDCPKNITDCYRPHCIPGDGVERGIITVNRQMPGPPVAVCKGDQVIVEINNKLHTEVTTMHFHGEHFRGYQYMDGTPYVTQCPILPEAKFVYNFNADVSGTMFYHSHVSFQRGDGNFGTYIVRQTPENEPNADLYDYDLTEHVIFPQEWFHKATRESFVLHHWDTGKNKADTILINGKGRTENGPKTPFATFNVKSGFRYRFRIISPGFTLCPIEVSVENHNLTLIASDTHSIVPMEVTSFIVHEGERYDFVLNAKEKSEKGVYQMRFGGLYDCSNLKAHGLGLLIYDNIMTDLEAASLDVKTDYNDFVNIQGIQVGPLNYAPAGFSSWNPSNDSLVPVSVLKHLPSPSKDDTYKGRALRENPDKTFYLAWDLLPKDNPAFHNKDYYSYEQVEGQNKLRTPQINNISLKLPPSPLLSQGHNVVGCNEDTLKNKDCQHKEFCQCTHILEVNLGDLVELVLIDEGYAYDVSHPFHLHGHSFYVVSMERHAGAPDHIGAAPHPDNYITREMVEEMNKSGKINKNLVDPPLKDNVAIPDAGTVLSKIWKTVQKFMKSLFTKNQQKSIDRSNFFDIFFLIEILKGHVITVCAGFTILRFVADNVGYWLFHCHMSWHNHLGMGLVIKVGDVENTIQPPPKGFPRCGNFEGSCSATPVDVI